MSDPRFYAAIWRWHFYAGLFVLPFVLVLSVTGAIYLFKPQIDRWEERAYRHLGTERETSPDQQLAAVMDANPGARFNHYRLPEEAGDAAMIQLALADGSLREVYVSPQGKVLNVVDPTTHLSDLVGMIHGSLLLGKWGDRLVELAASWAIVMMLSGLYLWWPRPFRLKGTLYPRLALKGRALLKDLHSVTGFWIAGFVLVILVSGLPWAGTWGGAFQWVRTELGWIDRPQDWKVGAGSNEPQHHHLGEEAELPISEPTHIGLPLSAFVTKAQAEHMAFPVLVLPPHAPQRFGPPTGEVWTAMALPQNRWLRRQVAYDPISGVESSRNGFSDLHVIDRVVNTGIAWHEGQLFGLTNQLIGLTTAIALFSISIIGVLMWLKRRPESSFGAPPAHGTVLPRWTIAALILLALLLPLFGASLIVVATVDAVVRRRPNAATA